MDAFFVLVRADARSTDTMSSWGTLRHPLAKRPLAIDRTGEPRLNIKRANDEWSQFRIECASTGSDREREHCRDGAKPTGSAAPAMRRASLAC